MKHLARIEAKWVKLALSLEQDLARATGAERMKVVGQQIINDQAYFMPSWGQLESEINDVCRAAVDRSRTHRDGHVRRAWDLRNPSEPRLSGLSFENRVRLVLDGQAGRASPFALTIKHDGSRDQIAHGELGSTRINVCAFVADCFTIRSALHRAS